MKDGLYRVLYHGVCAGFVVEGGRVKRNWCAPILRKRLSFWVTIAERIGD